MDRVDQILSSASELFIQKGFKSATVSEIARNAGVAKGLIYNYFDSKEVLLDVLVLRSVQKISAKTEALMNSDADPEEKLSLFITGLTDLYKSDKLFWKFILSLSVKPGTSIIVRKSLARKAEELTQALQQIFRELGKKDPDLEARHCLAALEGIFIHYSLAPVNYPIAKMQKHIVDAHLNS